MKYSLCFTKEGQLIYCIPEMRKEYKEETRIPSEFGNIIITLNAENANHAIEMAKKMLQMSVEKKKLYQAIIDSTGHVVALFENISNMSNGEVHLGTLDGSVIVGVEANGTIEAMTKAEDIVQNLNKNDNS